MVSAMKFTATPLVGAYVVDLEKREDSRGYFARSWCQKEFEQQKLETQFVQCNLSYNKEKGTLRGMHFQLSPHQEVKFVRCVSGSIYDVIIDLRKDSATYCKWFGVELSSKSGRALYVPKGFAHGYVTLENDSEVFYQVSDFYEPSAERGVRWNDPVFGIQWPKVNQTLISPKDLALPDFNPEDKTYDRKL